jgi:hypothetical protein
MGFQITIGEKMDRTILKDCYVINLSYMHGDGDHYTKDQMGPFNANSEEEMEQLKEALIICNKIHRNFKSIEDVEGFNKWFNAEEWEEDYNPFGANLDKDITCDEEFYCVLDNFKLVYYDANENPYKCNVQF